MRQQDDAQETLVVDDRLIGLGELSRIMGYNERTLQTAWRTKRPIPLPAPICAGGRKKFWRWATIRKLLIDLESQAAASDTEA
jgi:hypothetical protein